MATLTGGALGDVTLLQSTRDALFRGTVVLFQPRKGAGYRTNVDALLLAAFAAPAMRPGPKSAKDRLGGGAPPAEPRPTLLAYDLGAGVGAVSLALLRLGAARRVVLVEIDELAAELARSNVEANGWTDRAEVVRGDVRDVARSRPGDATLVVCNPPYFAPGRARVSPSQAAARVGRLETFVEAARQLAGRRARVCFVYPAQDLGAMLSALTAEGLHAKRMRLVHGTASAPARIALVEARAGRAGGLVVQPPLIEHTAQGYTVEMESILASR